jgi:pre-mRNA-splicing helicase BRR2
LITKLPEILNAEIVSGTIGSLSDAVKWFKRTYLYRRMRRAPECYNLVAGPIEETVMHNLLHSVLLTLNRQGLVSYVVGGGVEATDLGTI